MQPTAATSVRIRRSALMATSRSHSAPLHYYPPVVGQVGNLQADCQSAGFRSHAGIINLFPARQANQTTYQLTTLRGTPFPQPPPARMESEGGVYPARDFTPATPSAKGQIPHANLRQATPGQPAQRAALYR